MHTVHTVQTVQTVGCKHSVLSTFARAVLGFTYAQVACRGHDIFQGFT